MYSCLEKSNGFSIHIKIGLEVVILTVNIPFALWNGVTGMASVIYGNVFCLL